MKRIILCADDYGQNSAISQAIVELLREDRLMATSCLTNMPSWPAQANWLFPLKSQKEIGLHFNLTLGTPLSKDMPAFFSLKELIIKAFLKQLDPKAIAAELRAQLDQFENAMNQVPDFIDGHQHIHQLPIIRDILIEVYEERLREHRSYVRCTYAPNSLLRVRDVAYVKELIIQLCGGIAFQRLLTAHKIPHNSSFAGIYNFSTSYEYPQLFKRFINQVEDKGIIMCHPGLMSSEEDDVMATARHQEYLYFCSPHFRTDLANMQAGLTYFN